MKLCQGDKGDSVKDLQRGLNKLGSLLLVDGDFGTSTTAAVLDARQLLKLTTSAEADDVLFSALELVPDPSPELTAPGVTFIGLEEISSPALYRKKYCFPEWPGSSSGVTIGIGYDLKFTNGASLQSDWGTHLTPDTIDRLALVAGVTGSPGLLRQVQNIQIPLLAAVSVFLNRMLPQHVSITRTIYPTLDTLTAPRRAALIDLVFNRGPAPAGDRGTEMRTIAELLASGDLDAVADQFEHMARLWNPATEQGLIERRQREATLWREGFEKLLLA